MNILTWVGILFLGGVLVVAVGAMLIAAIDFLQNGDDR
jgi:hypothetical protein